MATVSAATGSEQRKGFFVWRWLWIALPPLVFLLFLEAVLGAAGVPSNRYAGIEGKYWREVLTADGIDGFQRWRPRPHKVVPEPSPAFVKVKPDNGFRLFLLGDSPLAGWPYDVGSISDWLQMRIEAMAPDRFVEVVNGANPGWHSAESADLLEECLEHAADVVVWMPGNSEFTPQSLAETRRSLSCPLERNAVQLLRRSRLVAIAALVDPAFAVERRYCDPEHAHGAKPYTDREVSAIRRRFYDALRRAHRAAHLANVVLILCTPPRNIRARSPLTSAHSFHLTQDAVALAEWNKLVEAGRARVHVDPVGALDCFERALALDDEFAALHYEMAQVLDSLGHGRRAIEHYRLAIEREVQPTRPRQWVLDEIRAASVELGCPLVDIERSFNLRGKLGLAGNELLLDNVHPTLEGQRVMADLVLEAIERSGRVSLDRSLDVCEWKGRFAEAVSRQNLYLTKRACTLELFQAAVLRPPGDATWSECMGVSDEVLHLAPEDHEVRAAAALLRAARSAGREGLAELLRALDSDVNVKLSTLVEHRTSPDYRRVLELANAPIADIEARLSYEVRGVFERRLERAKRIR